MRGTIATPTRARAPRRRSSGVVRTAATLVILLGTVGLWVVAAEQYDRALDTIAGFGLREDHRPSRLFARPLAVEPGQRLSQDDLAAVLTDLGYQTVTDGPLEPGSFRIDGSTLRVARRTSQVPGAELPAMLVDVDFEKDVVDAVRSLGAELDRATLEIPLLASFYDATTRDCWPVQIERLPGHVVQAILAAEDAHFYEHPGISLGGIARAAWSNATRETSLQGGSTITQQLVKNVYLTPERSLSRKLREALLAWSLERRYAKSTILEAYLNEIYLGTYRGVNLIGIGAAASHYFGKAAADLSVAEAATLAGLIASPGRFHPVRHADRARERRDRILSRMQELDWLSAEAATHARETPLTTRLQVPAVRRAPYFVAFAVEEARTRFGIEQLEGRGYIIHSTLDWLAQRSAESSVRDSVAWLEAKVERRRASPERPLQAALVSVDPLRGTIEAYVGGRDYEHSPFDRLSQARRQAGSVFKPFVYAAAIRHGVAFPDERLHDAPVTVEFGDRSWSPANYDRRYRGQVTMRQALERSLNVPTVRLAAETGFDRVQQLAVRMGVTSADEMFPALALGALDVTPLEIAGAYTALAGKGVLHPLRGVLRVHGVGGRQLAPVERREPRRVLDAATAELVTTMLRGVVDRGTGYGVRRLGLRDAVAGKTGTSSDHRDSWFVGYSEERLALSWVGYDDNTPTRLVGSRGAIRVWTEFMLATRPPQGYRGPGEPDRLLEVWIDPETGERAGPDCPSRRKEWIFRWRDLPDCHHYPSYSYGNEYLLATESSGSASRPAWDGDHAAAWRLFEEEPPAPPRVLVISANGHLAFSAEPGS